jgi:hypothetical protein
MAKTQTQLAPNETLYRTLGDSGATASELKKALKMDDAAFDEFIAKAKGRVWIEQDDTGKTTRYALTQYGRDALSSRYR